MQTLRNFFSSPLRSAAVTFIVTVVVCACVFWAIYDSSNRIIPFADAVMIASEDAGFDEFSVTECTGDLDCSADGSRYYVVQFKGPDQNAYTYYVDAKDGGVITSPEPL